MISFIVCLLLLITGYLTYGKIVDKTFGPDDRETPAVRINDGVDYVVMPQWKLFLVQLLNIAGLGPIFGALQGALWGPVVFLWITFGTIFAGGVHDYFSGMISERNDGYRQVPRSHHAEYHACVLGRTADHGRYGLCSRSGRSDRYAVQEQRYVRYAFDHAVLADRHPGLLLYCNLYFD